MPRDYYEVLGVSRAAERRRDQEGVPPARARAAPRRQPARPGGGGEVQGGRRGLRGALSDPERRAVYDRYGHDGLRSGGYQPNFSDFGSLSDIFEALLRRRRPVRIGVRRRGGGPGRGHDVGVEVTLTLEEVRPASTAGRGRGPRHLLALPRQRRRAGHADRDVPAVRRDRPAAVADPDGLRAGRADGRPATPAGARADPAPAVRAVRRQRPRDARRTRSPVDMPAGIEDGQRDPRSPGAAMPASAAARPATSTCSSRVDAGPAVRAPRRRPRDARSTCRSPRPRSARRWRRDARRRRGGRAEAGHAAGDGAAAARPRPAGAARAPRPRRPPRARQRDGAEPPDRRAARAAAALRGVGERRDLRRCATSTRVCSTASGTRSAR